MVPTLRGGGGLGVGFRSGRGGMPRDSMMTIGLNKYYPVFYGYLETASVLKDIF